MKKYQLFADIFLYIFLMILYNILKKVIILNKIRNTLSTLNIIFTICSIFVIIFEIVKIDTFMPIIINKEDLDGCNAYSISGTPADCVKMARLLFKDFIIYIHF